MRAWQRTEPFNRRCIAVHRLSRRPGRRQRARSTWRTPPSWAPPLVWFFSASLSMSARTQAAMYSSTICWWPMVVSMSRSDPRYRVSLHPALRAPLVLCSSARRVISHTHAATIRVAAPDALYQDARAARRLVCVSGLSGTGPTRSWRDLPAFGWRAASVYQPASCSPISISIGAPIVSQTNTRRVPLSNGATRDWPRWARPIRMPSSALVE